MKKKLRIIILQQQNKRMAGKNFAAYTNVVVEGFWNDMNGLVL